MLLEVKVEIDLLHTRDLKVENQSYRLIVCLYITRSEEYNLNSAERTIENYNWNLTVTVNIDKYLWFHIGTR